MNYEHCPVCKSSDVKLGDHYRGTNEIFSGMMRIHCATCSAVYASPMPSKEKLDAYNANYFSVAHGAAITDLSTLAFFSGIARLRLSYLKHYLTSRNITITTVLEFGPGGGFFAASWLKFYPKTSYIACETDKTCYANLNKIGVKLIDANTFEKETTPVDLVVMSHVLEHVAAPRDFIKDATGTLRAGGVLFIEVPCLDYKYKLNDEPHLFFYDKESIQYLLDVSGFTDIKLGYFGQEHDRLRSTSFVQLKWMSLRSKLINIGFIAPFALKNSSLKALCSPLESAVIAPFKAHCESKKPARWLRAVARKK
jgi:SAM-dependent methyltransferase